MSKAPIRILHVLSRMDYGGTETLLMNIYREIDKKEIQFDFAVCTDTEAPYDNEIKKMGGRIYYYPQYNLKNHKSYCNWWNCFFKTMGENYTIVHGHIGSTAAIYLNIAKKHNKFTIAHSHGCKGKVYNLRELAYRIYSFPTRFIAEMFLGCSKQAIIDRYGKRIIKKDKPVYILHNGIDVKKYKYDPKIRSKMRKKLGIDKNCTVIGHVGRCTEAKNPMFILQVFNEYHKINNNSVLIYIGKGELNEKITKEITKYGLEKYVIRIKETDIVCQFMQAMDIFLFPSLMEGLGIVAIEAQAASLRVLASDRVPIETKISDNIEYYSLSKSARFWSKKIEEAKKNRKQDEFEKIKNSRYNIKRTTKIISEIYKENHKEWRKSYDRCID